MVSAHVHPRSLSAKSSCDIEGECNSQLFTLFTIYGKKGGRGRGGNIVHLEVRARVIRVGLRVGVEGRNKGYCFTFHMPSDVALLCYK